jgi:transposase
MPRQHIIDIQMGGEQRGQQGIVVPLDLPELKILHQEVQEDGSIEVHVIAIREAEACPICATMCRNVHDTRGRVKRDIGIRNYTLRLILYKRRYRCLVCQRTFTESDQACGRYKRTTKRFREDLGRQAQQRPISHVAQEAKVGQRFVQECFEACVQERYGKQGRVIEETAVLHHTPRFLGIDEFARRKGHRYDTILCDLVSQQVIEISEGRTVEDLRPLFERLENPDVVQAVSMDMSASFRPAVEKFLPQASIVVDHFHVIQHVMKAFKKIVSSWANKKEGMILLHGKQHLFLKAAEDLTEEERQDRYRIGSRLPILEAAWQLKEDLRRWYETATVETAANELDTWIKRVQDSGFDSLKKALSAFVNWRKEILAFFQFHISNGFVEGKNNRTKTIMRQGYGFSNRQHLRLRILAGNAV